MTIMDRMDTTIATLGPPITERDGIRLKQITVTRADVLTVGGTRSIPPNMTDTVERPHLAYAIATNTCTMRAPVRGPREQTLAMQYQDTKMPRGPIQSPDIRLSWNSLLCLCTTEHIQSILRCRMVHPPQLPQLPQF